MVLLGDGVTLADDSTLPNILSKLPVVTAVGLAVHAAPRVWAAGVDGGRKQGRYINPSYSYYSSSSSSVIFFIVSPYFFPPPFFSKALVLEEEVWS